MKTIPITKLRSFYTALADFSFSTETQLNIAKDFNRGDNIKKLISLYKESKSHFDHKYDNQNESFLSDASRKPLNAQVSTISRTQDVIAALMSQNPKIKVDNPAYSFEYLQREVSPIRTTHAEFDTGKSGKSSGTGGLDFIGWNLQDDLPILGEIKVGSDQNLFYALIQLLTYLSELSTHNQIERINNTKLFGNHKILSINVSFYLYLIITDLSKEKRKLYEVVQELIRKIQDRVEIKEIKEIVVLFMDPKKKELKNLKN